MIREQRIYTFTDKNKNTEYKLISNIYIFFNHNLTLGIGKFLNIFIYIETFYAILLIFYNIILLLSKNFLKFKTITKYKLRKYFPLTNLIILIFYICKEPLFFFSTEKIVMVSSLEVRKN